MPGYSVRMKEEDEKQLDTDMLCVSCHNLLRNARQVQDCGHLYCEDCLRLVIARDHKCLITECGVPIHSLDDETFLDRAKQREVMGVMVMCYNSKCPWYGNLRTLERSHVSECKFNIIKCPHEGCERTFDDKTALSQHINTCAWKSFPCKFEHVGCTVWGSKQKLIEHCRENVVEHIALLYARLPSGGENVSSNDQAKINELERSIKYIEEALAQGEGQNWASQFRSEAKGGARSKSALSMVQSRDSRVNMSVLVGRVDRLESQLGELKQQIERRERFQTDSSGEIMQHQEKRKEVMKQLSNLETLVLQRDQALTERHKQIEIKEFASYNGVLHWKIGDFARRRREAVNGKVVSFYSHYFYTSRYGYKLRARIYLNGDGIGRGSHISLFFVVCKGEFDATLKWPFSNKVRLSIMDQNNIEDISDAFVPNSSSSSYQKPTTPMNIASGIPDFMELNLLEDYSRAFVKDDCLFVKISVEEE